MSMIIHKDSLPNIGLETSSFVYEGNYILIQDEYICDVLTCMNVLEINEVDFFLICGKYFKDYPQVLESYALKSARNVYYYARHALKGRFELGENLIANHAEYSYLYAIYALKGRFELGEPIIATGADCSYYYARDVLEGRFEMGEESILNSEYAVEYRERFLCP